MKRSSLAVAGLGVSIALAAAASGAPAQTPKRGGTIVVGPLAEPGCLNPVDSRCNVADLRAVLEPAFALAPDFTARPRLVSRATVMSRQPFTVRYEIRSEAHWSDGVAVTASDFVLTHRAIVEHLPPDRQGDHLYVRSVTRIGAKAVRIVFGERRATWRYLFPFVLPAHALRGQNLEKIWSREVADPRSGAPIGSGPFLVRSYQHGEQLTLVRNRNYWGPHPAYLDRIVIRFCLACGRQLTPSAEILEALRKGDVDLAVTRDTSIVDELRQIRGLDVHLAPLNGLDYLFFRKGPGGHSALRSKLVRRALAYGIDRVAIARSALGELARFGASDNAVLLKTSRFYRPNWKRYRYRPALARQFLEQAGCQRGADQIYICGGERLALRFFAPVAGAHRVRAVELMRAHLRRVGVDVRPTFLPAPILFSQIVPSGDFDGAVYAYFVAPDTLGAEVHGCGGAVNFTGYCQRLVTADLNQSELIVDPAQRARVLNRADARIAQDVPLIPLLQVPNVIAFRTTIRNVGSAAGYELWNAENWWLDD